MLGPLKTTFFSRYSLFGLLNPLSYNNERDLWQKIRAQNNKHKPDTWYFVRSKRKQHETGLWYFVRDKCKKKTSQTHGSIVLDMVKWLDALPIVFIVARALLLPYGISG